MEFALICPILCALLLGIFSFGVVYDTKLALTAAAREGARYGATVTPDQTFTSGSWAQNVRDLVVDRSTGALDGAGSTVCVALVSGSPARTHSVGTGTTTRPTTWYSTNSDGSPCDAKETYPVTTNDDGLRVQVVVTTPAEIQAVLYSRDVVLRSKATVQSESAS